MFFVERNACSPSEAKMRFSPLKGTISAMVAIATKSRNSEASFPISARLSFQATPVPHTRVSCRTAKAFGSTDGAVWWSVIITSIPCLFASATPDTEVMPQSTVMMRRVSSPARSETTVGFRPYPSISRCGTNGSACAPSR